MKTLNEITRYEADHFTSWYLPRYERAVAALKAAYPHATHWAACRVPRRWAQTLVAERDQQEPPVEGWAVALTMDSGRVVAAPEDDNFVVVGMEKPHGDSAFATDSDFFGGCVWLPL